MLGIDPGSEVVINCSWMGHHEMPFAYAERLCKNAVGLWGEEGLSNRLRESHHT